MGDASVEVNFDAIAVLRRWPSLGGGSMPAGISAVPILRPSKQHRPSPNTFIPSGTCLRRFTAAEADSPGEIQNGSLLLEPAPIGL
jgi:hypothetical protein